MISDITDTFPSGFVQPVAKAAHAEGIAVKLVDRRKRPCVADPLALLDWLRDYQMEGIEAARKSERGVFHHATGAGKTEVAIGLTELFPCRWLFLTHRQELALQTAKRFVQRTGEDVGLVLKESRQFDRRVTVAMLPTIYSGLKQKVKVVQNLVERVEGVMLDECHIAPAATIWYVLMRLTNAYYRYGFSGTPFSRSDKKSIFLWGAIGQTIHRVTAQRLIDAGVLAKPKIRMLPLRQKTTSKVWSEAYESAVVGSKLRNKLVLAAVDVATKPCFVFVNHIKHGHALAKAIGEKHSVEFVWGQKKVEIRAAAVQRLVNGSTDVIVCNVVFQEGLDVPELQSVVVAQGGKSVIATLQRLGRGTRRTNSSGKVTKEEFEVFDIADQGCGCRTPNKHYGCRWMERHAKMRIASYASEKFEIAIDSFFAKQALEGDA